MKKNFLSKIVSFILVALLIIPQVILNVSAADKSPPQTRGVAASILRGATLTSNNNSPANVNDKYNFTLKITGTALAEIGMDDKKTAVFAVPPELRGKVTLKSKIIVDATFLPFALKDITGIASPLAAVGKAVDALVTMGGKLLPPVDLKFIKTAYNTMITQNISSYHAEITATISADGSMIYANFNDDLNTYVVNSLQNLITTFSEVLKMVPPAVALQAPLTALTNAINTLKSGLTVATIGPSLNANFLSTTTASLAVEVANPTTSSSIFKGDILSNSSIDVSLFDGLGGATTIIFNAPWDGYTVPTPIVNPVSTKSTEVTGSIDTTIAPAGTTFEAKVTIGGNPPQTVTVDSSGNFTYPITDTLVAGEAVSVTFTATNTLGETKDSPAVTVTITDASTPWDGYTVPTPIVNPVSTKSTEVTGSIDVTGAPAGTTFEAKVTIGGNPPQTVTVDSSGNFSYAITTETISTGEMVSVVITATNTLGETKDSPAVTVIITDASTPWDGYTVPTPTIAPVSTKSTEVTGSIDVTGAPAGTTFEAKVTIGGNPPQTVTVDSSGNFTYTITDTLVAGETVSVTFTATNTLGETKDSPAVTVTITDASTPWDGYTVPTPTVAPVSTKSTEVTGSIDTTIAPAGTTFEAKVTIGGNPPQTVTVDSSGNFTYPITDTLVAGEAVSVTFTATNTLGETKDSPAVTVTITDASTPWDGYTVPTPIVNPVSTKSTEVTGSIDTTIAPAGTTFEAKVTIWGNPPQTVTVDSSGNFSYAITTETISTGELVSVVITATNTLGETKDSPAVTVIITDGSTPWDGYTVPTPTVAPVSTKSTEVTGSIDVTGAPAGTTFEAKVTIGGNPPQTVTVDSSGNFTYMITDTLVAGEAVSVVITATNTLGETKDSPAVTVIITDASTPWDGYTVPTPIVNPVSTKSTEVTGSIDVTGAPAGTTFEAKVTIGGNPPQTVTVDSSGNFSYAITTETISTGELVSVVITATNTLGETKDSPAVTVIITDASTPWDGYTVPTPTVAPVSTKSTEVTGSIDVTGAPAGTTFEAKVTIGGNPPKTVTVDSSGNFTYTITDTLVAGETVSVTFTATNTLGETKDSPAVTVTITDASTPWDGYTVPTPTVAPVSTKSTEVTGSIDVTGAPAGTTFEAKVTIGGNPPQTVTVDSSGNFTYMITDTLVAGEAVSVVITATNTLGETKDSPAVTVTITDASTPWDGYTVPTPIVNPVSTKSTEVTGSIDTTIAPAGTTFEAKVTIGGNPPQTVTVDSSGNFSYAITDTLVAGEAVSVTFTATNTLGETKDSPAVTVTITDASTPWDGYTVPTPTVAPVSTKSTEVTGSIDVTGAPAGTTFEAKVTIGGNPPQTVTVDSSGNFTYPITDTLVAGEAVSVTFTATNTLGETKDSPAVTVIITDASTPWDGYTVPTPIVNPVSTKSTEVTGSIDTTIAPAGTTFEAKVTIWGNPPQTVTVDSSGNFSYAITTETISTGELVSVVITATNTLGETKGSPAVTVIITDGSTPWDGYTVPTPTVAPVSTKSTEVTGSIDVTGAPAGTTFEAKVTIGGNPPQTVTVDSSGNFSYAITTETISAGEMVSVTFTATNTLGETKDSPAVTVTITDASTPWDGYTVPTPIVNPVSTKSTEVTGSIDVTGAPAGTTFEAKVTIGGNPPQPVTIDPSGDFSHPVTEPLIVGETVTVVVTATNGGESKTATVTVTIDDGSTPWDGYTVPTPTVAPVSTKSTEVTGNIDTTTAPAGTTFEAKVTIGGNPPQPVTIDPSGDFSHPVTETISAGETVSVTFTATNILGETKDSPAVTVTITDGSTPWDGYTVPTPIVNPVSTKSTEVTGSIDTTIAPAGTTFEAKVTIGGNPPQPVTIDPSGDFSHPVTEPLIVGETVTVVVTATNGGESKTATVTVTIDDGSTPWDGYTVPTPTVAPVSTKSTEVTGNIDTTTAPAGTTFEAKVTIGGNPPQPVTIDPSGDFSHPVTETISAGETVSVTFTATNILGETKDSPAVTVTITDGSTPWDGYTVPTPIVNPVSTKSTEVTGSIDTTIAPAGTTFEAKVTIGGNPPQPVTIDPSGDFSHPVTEPLIVGETVTVVVTATNGGESKTATVTVTIDDGGRMVLGFSGSSRRSGGSKGGSSKADMSSSIPSALSSNAHIYWGCLSGQLNPLTLTQATELFNTSLQNMPKNTTTLVLRAYNKTDVDISVLNSLKAMADKNRICVIIHFDYIVNKSVVSRIQVNPETATKSINLCLVARKHNLPKTNYLIKTYGDNVLRLEFAQKVNFGVNTSVTIKLPQNYKGDGIDFYQLNSATGKYTKISPVYSINSKRYLAFNISTTEHIYICGN